MDFLKSEISYFTKIRPWGTALFHADGQTEMTKLIVAFQNFANAPKSNYKSVLPSVFYILSCILSTSFCPNLCMYLILPMHDNLNSAVFTSLKTTLFWGVTSCSSVEMYSRSVLSFCNRFSFSFPFTLISVVYVSLGIGIVQLLVSGLWNFQAWGYERVTCTAIAVSDWRKKQQKYPSPWHLTYREVPSASIPDFSASQKLTYGL
jgi:hypothetical protein